MSEQETFEHLDIGMVVPSATNPRKHFDPKKLAELTDSVKTNGILQPILVRPGGGTKAFEIVAGERRYRAAKAAGLETVPAVIRQLTDEAVIECQVVENGQREDVHPMEEASGYHALMRITKHDVGWIAGRVGKSEKYVYDRMKLLELIKEAQKLFWDGKFSAGHAIILARLTPAQQKEIIDPDNGVLFISEKTLYGPDEEDQDHDDLKTITVRELQAHIDQHVRFAPEKADTFLFPETTQAVKTAREEQEKVVFITHDSFVPSELKTEQKVIVCTSWHRADGKKGSKTCEHAVTGVIVIGADRGEAFKVCLAKKDCKKHWANYLRERIRQRAQSGQTVARETDSAAEKKAAQDETKRRAERAMRLEVERRTVQAVAQKVKTPIKGEDLYDLAVVLIQGVMASGDLDEEMQALLGFKDNYPSTDQIIRAVQKTPAKNLERYLYLAALCSLTDEYSGGQPRIKAAAKRYKINVKAIEKDVRATMKADEPEQDEEADEKPAARANGKKKKAA
jgi:ParB/RepB/Spo0J family partition protein